MNGGSKLPNAFAFSLSFIGDLLYNPPNRVSEDFEYLGRRGVGADIRKMLKMKE
mgnify:CR=1 FL=1